MAPAIALPRKKGFDAAGLCSASERGAPRGGVCPGSLFVRRMRMKTISVIGVALAALIAGAVAVSAKTLVYCSEGSPENFTPAINTTGTSFDAARPVYNRLTEFKRGTTEVVPGLAESWDISDGGRTITFHLRKGVKFHSLKDFKPTRDFNADDVLWSFDRQWKPDHPYFKVSGGKYDYFNDMDMPTLLDSVTKADDSTVVMKLKEPNVAILANLAMDFMAIGSKEYADFLLKKGTPEQFDQAPVGTGPFSFVAYQKDSVIRYKANKDYYGEKPLVDDLVFAITPDATARYAKLKAGECHVNAYPRPADLAEMEKDPSLKVIHAPGLNIAFWAFNLTKPPLDKKEVRQALSMAVDRDAIIKDVYLGAGEKATTLIPPTMWAFDDKIPNVTYDPEKAKTMLAAAGVTTPLDIDLWYMPVQRPYNPNGKRIGEMMQADLAKIGVNAKLVTYEWGEYRKRAQGGEDMTAQLGWTGDNGDPDNFFFLDGCTDGKPASNNIPKWCNAEFNDLLAKARTIPDQAERAKLYTRMQEIEHDEQPELLLAHSTVFEAMRANVTGYKQSPLGTHAFEGVDIQ
jgi:dipeptide transport system substrate-binding protein